MKEIKTELENIITKLEAQKKVSKYLLSPNSERNGRINRDIRLVQNKLKETIILIDTLTKNN